MSLTSRVTAFFLAALGVVLVGFSIGLYWTADRYLHRRDDERLMAAMNTLVACSEIKPEGVEWEPQQRKIVFNDNAAASLRWLVTDDRGTIIDRSDANDDPLADRFSSDLLRDAGREDVWWGESPWRLVQRSQVSTRDGAAMTTQRPAGPNEGPFYPSISITVGMSVQPTRTTLWSLAATLVALSSSAWLLAWAGSRALCRNALRPVRNMVAAVQSLGAENLSERIPTLRTNDELAELGSAFNGLLDRLQESFERQRRFAGEASHQLRTPLTAMMGQAEVALRRDRSPEEYRRALGSVQQQAKQLHRLVESLLFLARADAESRSPDLEDVPVRDWFAQYQEAWSKHARASDLEFVVDCFHERMVCQPVLLANLLNNLIDNAIKFSEASDAVRIVVARVGDEIRIAVEDRGLGIAGEDVERLFHPFFRSADARRLGIGGTGLGLAIARRLAQVQGGRLEAVSSPGEGSRFTLYLPMAPGDPPSGDSDLSIHPVAVSDAS
jgi:heavy metal sensor kinase